MTITRPSKKTGYLLAAGLLPLWLAVGCSGNDNEPDADRAGVDTAPEETAVTGSPEAVEATSDGEPVTSLSETFDDDSNGWALPPGAAGTTEVTGGDFVWRIKEAGLRPHVLATTLGMVYDAGNLDMTDVRVTATATPRRGAGAFGLFCREVPDTDADFQWYEFVVRDGYSAIRLADSAGHLAIIEEGDARVPLGEVAELDVSCVDDELSLELNGQVLLNGTASEPLGNGVAGLQAYDATEEESYERLLLAWHDFAVTAWTRRCASGSSARPSLSKILVV